jgi:cytokinesis protein
MSQISHLYHQAKHGSETFHFPRPEDDETIEELFKQVVRTRELGDLNNMTIEQKWQLVFSDEQLRWKEQLQREEQERKQAEKGQALAIVEGSPQWYIKKFLDRTITPKQAQSLMVSLRGNQMLYVGDFFFYLAMTWWS